MYKTLYIHIYDLCIAYVHINIYLYTQDFIYNLFIPPLMYMWNCCVIRVCESSVFPVSAKLFNGVVKSIVYEDPVFHNLANT